MAERAAGEAVRRAWSSRQDPVPTVSGAVGHGAIPGCSRDAGGGGARVREPGLGLRVHMSQKG